jgi:hypothetical protein
MQHKSLPAGFVPCHDVVESRRAPHSRHFKLAHGAAVRDVELWSANTSDRREALNAHDCCRSAPEPLHELYDLLPMINIRKPEKLRPPVNDNRKIPPAGPHARPELMDEEKTPGTGSLPPVGESDDGNASPTG